MWTIYEIEGVWFVGRHDYRTNHSRAIGRFDNKLGAVRLLNILNGGTGEFDPEYVVDTAEWERSPSAAA